MDFFADVQRVYAPLLINLCIKNTLFSITAPFIGTVSQAYKGQPLLRPHFVDWCGAVGHHIEVSMDKEEYTNVGGIAKEMISKKAILQKLLKKQGIMSHFPR